VGLLRIYTDPHYGDLKKTRRTKQTEENLGERELSREYTKNPGGGICCPAVVAVVSCSAHLPLRFKIQIKYPSIFHEFERAKKKSLSRMQYRHSNQTINKLVQPLSSSKPPIPNDTTVVSYDVVLFDQNLWGANT
jgi:hypothetical protein